MGTTHCELECLRNSPNPENYETPTAHILRKQKQISRKILVFASIVALTGVVCLITGIALLRISQSKSAPSTKSKPVESNLQSDVPFEQSANYFSDRCGYSHEFRKSGNVDSPVSLTVVRLSLFNCLITSSNLLTDVL